MADMCIVHDFLAAHHMTHYNKFGDDKERSEKSKCSVSRCQEAESRFSRMDVLTAVTYSIGSWNMLELFPLKSSDCKIDQTHID
jgi:hypothetical protein